ncbi:hypothetical protein HispidOSU_029376 [Sigmodon hispidus]
MLDSRELAPLLGRKRKAWPRPPGTEGRVLARSGDVFFQRHVSEQRDSVEEKLGEVSPRDTLRSGRRSDSKTTKIAVIG